MSIGKFELPKDLVSAIKSIDQESGPDPDLPCRTCGEEDLENPIYDRDLGGPYCSAACRNVARTDAVLDSYMNDNDKK